MTYAGGSGTDYLGFKDILIAMPPWYHDTNVTHAWDGNVRRLTWTTSSTWQGAPIASVVPSAGANSIASPGGGQAVYQQDATSLGAPYIKHTTGASASFDSGPPAVAANGTAVPISFAIAGKLPAAPNYLGATGAQWMLFSFSSTSSTNQVFSVFGSRGSTNCKLQRTNNSGTPDTGATLALGTSWFVLIGIYSGTTLTTRLSGVVVDNALSAPTGGACTFDTFSVGGYNGPSSGLFSDLYWTDMILGVNKTWAASTYKPIENYLRRKVGV